jgi:predicted ATPase/GAF domain-containing protein/predicted Ser/Thr protein kinase
MSSLQHYTLTRQIHDGAAATIYQGHRHDDGASVAIKILRGATPSARDVAKLRHEYAITRGLHIAGVVKTYGLVKYGSGLGLVMEDIDGPSLHSLLQARRLDLETVLQIAASLADTLESLHRHSITHKDIKPHNIIINTSTKQVKIIDFGIATRLSQETQRAKTPGLLEGTLAYMSPEQTGRMSRVIDHRTDLYSLGVTFYEMLTGVLPFQTVDPMELVHSHIARTPAPPHALAPNVPRVVSDIVMKLLSKAAEDRYQRGHGLKADLEECLRQLDATGEIAPFPIGDHDIEDELRIRQKLYGREAELSALTGAFARASGGSAELLLISGYAGVGKSTLVNEIHKAIARERGYFITGKFDQLTRSVPYMPVAHAFRELVRQLLTEPADALARWESALKGALGASGQLLVNLVPELSRMIGPQPSVPELGPTESQNRFNLLVQRFLRVFTTKNHPLVIFLDDLQWADPASLNLLRLLLTDPERGFLLVIGAYRDTEVDAVHPLSSTLSDLRKTDATIGEIQLEPLDLPNVTAFVAEALGRGIEEVAPLAKLALDKTQGNPFFLGQFLRALHEDQLLSFDARSRSFRWDLQRIRQAELTDNVVSLMASKLHRLAPSTQHLLKLAACIGHQFDLSSLSVIAETSPSETATRLWDALREGLVQPLDPEYRFLPTGDTGDEPEVDAPPNPAAFNVSYRFLHDRVQQAAYSLIDDQHKHEVHLRIGRLLQSKGDQSASDEALFAVVHHMNLGAALITDPGEREDLARLNLAAGGRAKAASAYHAAARYLGAGASLLGEGGFERAFELSFELGVEQAECEHLSGAFEKAESLFELLLSHARSNLERARVGNLRVILSSTLGRFVEALDAGIACLRLFGIDIPGSEEERRQAVDAELSEVRAKLTGRRIQDLLDAPALADPGPQAALQVLMNMTPAAYIVSPATLYVLIVGKQVTLSLKYGHSAASSHGYMSYGLLLAGVFGEYREAFEIGKMALDLNEKLGSLELKAKLNFLFGVYVHFSEPLRATLAYFARAHEAGLASGNFSHPSYACFSSSIVRFSLGDDLGAVREELEGFLSLMQRTKDLISTLFLRITKQAIANLTGGTTAQHSLSDDTFDEARFVETTEATGLTTVICWYYTIKLELSFLYEDHESALSMADEAEKRLLSSVGFHFTTDLTFYTALALLALCGDRPAEREGRLSTIAAHEAKLATWAAHCPENYRHKHLLVRAERARIEGRAPEAEDLYEQALDAAEESGFARDEALANELCAKFYLEVGRKRNARLYMTNAYAGYLGWGATAKVELLAEKYADLLLGAAPAARRDERTRMISPTATITTTGRNVPVELLDAAASIRAAQAIAGEIVLAKVLDRLMWIVLENAGAQRGALLLEREGKLSIEATITVDPDVVRVGPSVSALTSADLAVSIVQYVSRTREALVLHDASHESRFASDPYIVAQRPKSILCLPMTHQSRLTGVLYLENNSASGAFTQGHIELCGLLSSQAAIAVENALLYADVKEATEELRRSNDMLEEQVAHRTEELCRANEQLARELTERSLSEKARAALQEEIIRVQDERLTEVSTPLIPITDRIMVMPLIGTMDAKRAEQVLAVALLGAQSNHTAVVIIDITGVKVMDTAVANTLVKTAAALRLLGTEAVLTGIAPHVAQTLIGLTIDFGSIVTRGTLQSGIAYALTRSGQQGLPDRGGSPSTRSAR